MAGRFEFEIFEIRSETGTRFLIVEGDLVYKFYRENSDTVSWKCREKGCNAYARTRLVDGVLQLRRTSGIHDHSANGDDHHHKFLGITRLFSIFSKCLQVNLRLH